MLVEKTPFCLLACGVTHSSQYSSFTLNFFSEEDDPSPSVGWGRVGEGPTNCHPRNREFMVHPKGYPGGGSGEDCRPIDLHKVADNFPLDQKLQDQALIGTWKGDILVSGWQD